MDWIDWIGWVWIELVGDGPQVERRETVGQSLHGLTRVVVSVLFVPSRTQPVAKEVGRRKGVPTFIQDWISDYAHRLALQRNVGTIVDDGPNPVVATPARFILVLRADLRPHELPMNGVR